MYCNDTGLYNGYIYCVENSVNGRKYVGQTTVSIAQRWAAHCSAARTGENTYLYRSMRKYGEDAFIVTVLDFIHKPTRQELLNELNALEIFYIEKLNTFHPAGYNLTRGGQAFSVQQTRAVFAVDANGYVLERYNSLRSASVQTNIDEKSIQHACNSKSHYGKGMFWYYDDSTLCVGENIGPQSKGANNWKGHATRPKRAIHRYSLDGIYIDSFESATDAQRKTGIKQDSISACCRGVNNRKTAGGYRWSFTM